MDTSTRTKVFTALMHLCEVKQYTEAKAVYVDWYRLSSAAEDINLHSAFTNIFSTMTLALAQMQVSDEDSEDESPPPAIEDIKLTVPEPQHVFVDGGVKIYGPEYAAAVLGIDANTLLTDLRASIPEAPHQDIEMFKDQWIMGNNPCLNSRGPKKGGRPMPRNKLFLQKDDPAVFGVRQYQYTAKQNRVDLVHFDLAFNFCSCIT